MTGGEDKVRLKPLFAAAVAGAVLCSCSGSQQSGEDNEGLAVVDNGGGRYNINTPHYEFPEFLNRIGETDILSNVNTKSFDASMVTEVSEQPFEGYDCKYFYPGFYIYESGGFEGVLDSDGNVVLNADTFSRVEFVSPTLIRLYLYDFDSSNFVYADISDKNAPQIIDNYKFRSADIKTAERKQEDSDRVLVYLEVKGVQVGSFGFDSAQQKDISELPADSGAVKAYTVTKDGAYYIITFDEFYNYTIYEGTYASININIAGQSGSCYIMSYEDTIEAKTLTDSFAKSENTAQATEQDDYISFDFGLYGEDDYLVTVYSSGAYISQGVKGGVEFYESANVDTRCFVDLVRWTDSVVSKEYTNIEGTEINS